MKMNKQLVEMRIMLGLMNLIKTNLTDHRLSFGPERNSLADFKNLPHSETRNKKYEINKEICKNFWEIILERSGTVELTGSMIEFQVEAISPQQTT